MLLVGQDRQCYPVPSIALTEDGFRRIVVWACLGQTDPVQFEPAHQSPRLLRLTRVGGILIERDPDLRIAIRGFDSNGEKNNDLHGD